MRTPRARKAVRFIHLAVNGIWLGAVVSALLLVRVGSPQDPAPYLAAFRLHDNIVAWLAGVVVFTALFFAFYTHWGLITKWWVAGKWLGLFALGLGIPLAVTPAVNELAARADVLLVTGAPDVGLGSLSAKVSLLLTAEAALLILLFALSAWRPAGETGIRWEEKPLLRRAIITLAVVVVTFALFVSSNLERARRTPLVMTSAEEARDGSCAAGIDWLGAEVAVEVTVGDRRIRRLAVLDRPAGHYPELGALVIRKVEKLGRLDVDGVSGATTSARAILVAASKALEAMQRDPASCRSAP